MGDSPVEDRMRRVRLFAMDVDGVLTDGSILLASGGEGQVVEVKAFHVRDGLAVKWAGRLGIRTAIVTARSSPAVEARAREIGIHRVEMGVTHKGQALRRLAVAEGLDLAAVAYVGDDLADLPALRCAGLGIAVADACAEVREAAHWVTRAPGGGGAVREALEAILRAQGLWAEVVAAHEGETEE